MLAWCRSCIGPSSIIQLHKATCWHTAADTRINIALSEDGGAWSVMSTLNNSGSCVSCVCIGWWMALSCSLYIGLWAYIGLRTSASGVHPIRRMPFRRIPKKVHSMSKYLLIYSDYTHTVYRDTRNGIRRIGWAPRGRHTWANIGL